MLDEPQGSSESLRRELLALVAEDLRVREALAHDESLYQGYHPRMEAVHVRNAARLSQIIAEHGWPGSSLVGRDGAEAAWLIVQHAIGKPAFMRSCLVLLQRAAASGEAEARHAAMLEDRIRVFEGRPQRYGTQIETDSGGRPKPPALEDPETIDERRQSVGLEPLEARLERAAQEPVHRPRDPAQFEREYGAWLVRTGWRRG